MFDLYSKKMLLLIVGLTLIGLGAGIWWWFRDAATTDPASRVQSSTWRYFGYFLMALGGVITAVAAFLYFGKKV